MYTNNIFNICTIWLYICEKWLANAAVITYKKSDLSWFSTVFKYIFFDFLFFIFLTFNIYIVKILIVADMNPLCGTPGCVSFFIKKFFRCFLQVSVFGGGDKMLCENSRPRFREKFEKTVAIPERVWYSIRVPERVGVLCLRGRRLICDDAGGDCARTQIISAEYVRFKTGRSKPHAG